MSTQIEAIYDALADMDLYVDGTHVGVRGLDSLPNTVPSGILPVRLLLPLGTRAEARAITPVTVTGSVATAQWRLTDLLLWLPKAQGKGLETVALPLVRYMKAYFDGVQALGFKLGRTATVESLAFEPAVITYPSESAAQYYGVEVTLSVKEIA